MQRRAVISQLSALRAFAIVAVVGFHLWPAAVPGGFVGVDILFVVSGFLITDLLVRDAEGTGRIHVRKFIARRAARLVPAALTVIAASALLVFAAAPHAVWAESARQAIASATYTQNWYLYLTAQQYIAASQAATPFQHFWSLGVEAQLYAIWVIAAVVVVSLVRIPRVTIRAKVAIGIIALSALSLVVSIVTVHSAASFFSTATRLWEFGAGGLLAVAAYVMENRWRFVVAGIGWAVLVAGSIVLTTGVGFPGIAAVVPVIGAAMVVVGGPMRVHDARPIVFMAGISYSLYLWHWPLVVVWPYFTGARLTWSDLIAVAAVAMILATATTTFIERAFWKPFSESSVVSRRRLVAGAAFSSLAMVVVLAVGTMQLTVVDNDKVTAQQELDALAATNGTCFGATALADTTCPAATMPNQEALTFATNDWGPVWGSNMPVGFACTTAGDSAGGEHSDCVYEQKNPVRTIALAGDSHAAQWTSALIELAAARHWRLLIFDRSGCPIMDAQYLTARSTNITSGCVEWEQKTVAQLESRRDIDLIFVGGYYGAYALQGATSHQDQLAAPSISTMISSAASRWTATGKRVVILGDTPRATFDPATCLTSAAGSLSTCSFLANEPSYADTVTPLVTTALARDPLVRVIDPTPWLCVNETCPPVVGGVVTLVDNNHMSATYSRSLSTPLARSLQQFGWLG